MVTKGFRTLDVDLDEVYCLNDFEEDDTGDHISLPGLATSTPVQHPETSGEGSRARVTVSGSRSYPRRPQAFAEDMQEPPAAEEKEEEEEEGSGEGTSISPVNPAPLPEAEFWAILTSVPSTIRSGSVCSFRSSVWVMIKAFPSCGSVPERGVQCPSCVTNGCHSLPILEVHGLLAGLLTGEQERLLKRSGLLPPLPCPARQLPCSCCGSRPESGGQVPEPRSDF